MSAGTVLAIYVSPSSLSLVISTSNESTPSSTPFSQDITFTAPFRHCAFSAGSVITKYAEAAVATTRGIGKTFDSRMFVVLGVVVYGYESVESMENREGNRE